MSSNPSHRTLAGRVDNMQVSGWHWKLLLLCAMGIMLENYDAISLAMVMPVIAREWEIQPSMIGVLLSGSSLGLLIGAFVFGTLSDIIGRKKSFLFTTAVFSLFVFLSTFSNSFTQLYIARVLAGIGLGGFIPVASAYVSEFAPVKVRGRFMGLFTIGNGIGYCSAVVAAMFLVPAMQDGWRLVFAVGGIGVLLIPIVYKTLPESVKWLQGKGRIAEAISTVEGIERKVLGKITVPHDEAVELSQQGAQASGPKQNRFRTLFTKDLLTSSVLAAIIWFVSGYTFYGFIQWMPTFLTKNMGYTLTAGYTFTLIGALIGTGTPGILVGWSSDYLGRRPTLILCMLMYAAAGFLFLWFGGWWILPLYWFSSAMTSAQYVYSPELFPTTVRGTGLGFSSSIGRVAGFLAPMMIGLTVQDYGLGGVITINGILLVICTVVILLLGKETRDRSAMKKQSPSL
ncbi:MFS transporter [Brevibacillus sp. B_LB10_24]|uniref:MFS transporter n=1 Tax=Brevibacillus sp. B_LB10_24 TaxID=3380645 RepID=UPI0038BB9E83